MNENCTNVHQITNFHCHRVTVAAGCASAAHTIEKSILVSRRTIHQKCTINSNLYEFANRTLLIVYEMGENTWHSRTAPISLINLRALHHIDGLASVTMTPCLSVDGVITLFSPSFLIYQNSKKQNHLDLFMLRKTNILLQNRIHFCWRGEDTHIIFNFMSPVIGQTDMTWMMHVWYNFVLGNISLKYSYHQVLTIELQLTDFW